MAQHRQPRLLGAQTSAALAKYQNNFLIIMLSRQTLHQSMAAARRRQWRGRHAHRTAVFIQRGEEGGGIWRATGRGGSEGALLRLCWHLCLAAHGGAPVTNGEKNMKQNSCHLLSA